MALDEGTGGQVLDKGAIDPWGSGEVKASQGLLLITAREFELASQALLAASLQLVIQQQGQEIGGTELA